MERKELMLPLTDVCLKASGEGYTFEGYASKFNGVDSYGDTILPGAYKNALKDLKVSGRMPKMFFNHKAWELPVGKWTKASEDDEGLYVAGSLTKGMRLSEDLRLALADNTLDGLSVGIGMKSEDYEWVEDSKSKISRIIKNVSVLREVSLVTFPADDKGRIDSSSIKAELDDVQTIQDLERFLREAGSFSKTAAAMVVSRATTILRGEPVRDDAQKVQEEAAAMLKHFQLPTFGA
jgi:HK97 family phage prohead protease